MSEILGKIGTNRDVTPSTGYMCFYPAMQPVADGTVITDRSGKGNHASFGVNLTAAAAWANPGYFTTAASATQTQYGQIPHSVVGTWNFATECLVIAFRGKFAAPAATLGIFGNALKGVRVRAIVTSNTMDVALHNDGATEFGCSTVIVVCDGTEHSICLFVSKLNNRMYMYVDGVYRSERDISAVTAITWAGTETWRIGQAEGNNGLTSQFHGIHVAKKTGALPADHAGIANRLHNAPFVPLSQTEWPSS